MSSDAAQFPLPGRFTVVLSERHPLVFPGGPDIPGVQDLSRFIYHARIECEGRIVACESPAFSAADRESERAFEILFDIINYSITDSVLRACQKPRYEIADGVITRITKPENES